MVIKVFLETVCIFLVPSSRLRPQNNRSQVNMNTADRQCDTINSNRSHDSHMIIITCINNWRVLSVTHVYQVVS